MFRSSGSMVMIRGKNSKDVIKQLHFRTIVFIRISYKKLQNTTCIFEGKVLFSKVSNTLKRRVHDMRDDRERWQLEASYHKVMENYL